VESYRQDGKVKQRVLEYLGKEENGKAVRKRQTKDYNISKVTQFLDSFVIKDVSDKIGLSKMLNKIYKPIMTLILSHMIEKISIYKIPVWLQRTDILNILKLKKITSNELYNALTELSQIDFDSIQMSINSFFRKLEDDNKSAVLDITDTYFNGSKANWKSRRGKDGKYNKLIQIALAVSFTSGFPIMHKVYEGNTSNVKIFEDMINDLKVLGYESIIIDRGMCSKKNIKNIQDYEFKSILGMRLTTVIGRDYLSKISRDEIFTKQCRVQLKATNVYIKSFDYMDGKLIAVFNPNIEVAKKEKEMDIVKKNKLSKYAGYSLIYTNTTLDEIEVVRKYFEKDIVERSFKKLKNPISLQPLRLSNLEHIKSHIKVCYLAYCIYSYIEYKVKALKISATEALYELNGGYKVYLEDKKSNKVIEKVVTLSKKQEQILSSLNVVYNF